MVHSLICKHGNEIGKVYEPRDIYINGAYAGQQTVLHRITSPVCDLCLLEAVGLGVLADGESTKQERP